MSFSSNAALSSSTASAASMSSFSSNITAFTHSIGGNAGSGGTINGNSSSNRPESEAPANIRVLVRVRPLNSREAKFNPNSVLGIENGSAGVTGAGGGGNGHRIDFGVGRKNDGGKSEASVRILDPGFGGTNGYNSDGGMAGVGGMGGSGASGSAQASSSKSFTYDAVFGPNSKQTEIFESIKGIIDAVCAGYNGTIVAYGQTGSGKTHTIFGEEGFNDNASAGLVQRSLKAIFYKIAESHVENVSMMDLDGDKENARRNTEGTSVHTTTKASFLEIYNERVYDLLSSTGSSLDTQLPVREDAQKGVYVEGLSEVEVTNTLEAMEVLKRGMDNRRVAATNMNRVSSRSHAMFSLTVKSEIRGEDGLSKVRVSKFTLVDLAGSERQKTTNADGERLKEASMINNSLLCLGQVINSLVDREKGRERHVPFRDSKLTFLLRDSWGGNSKTCLVATVTPSMLSLTETVSTLKFAQRAKLIKNTAVLNEDTCVSIATLQAEIARLKEELNQRNRNTASADNVRHSMPSPGMPPLHPRQHQFKSDESADNEVDSEGSSDDAALFSALRSQNSKLEKRVKTLSDEASKKEEQVKTLKRKLREESYVRKTKERRIEAISTNNPNEEVSALEEEIKILRQQLERPSAETTEWLIRYKREKEKVDTILSENPEALKPSEKDVLQSNVTSLMNEKDSLQKQVENLTKQRDSEIDSILADVTKLENSNIELQSTLDKKTLEALQSEEKIRSSEIQLSELQDEMKKAIECLEVANSNLEAERKRVTELEGMVEGGKVEVDESKCLVAEYKSMVEKAEESMKELEEKMKDDENDFKGKLSQMQSDLDLVMDENDSLQSKLIDATEKLESMKAVMANLEDEKNNIMKQVESGRKDNSAAFEDLNLQKESLAVSLKEAEDEVELIHREKSEAEQSLKHAKSNIESLSVEVESWKAENAKLSQQMDSFKMLRDNFDRLEDELIAVLAEREIAEEDFEFVEEDAKRSIRLHDHLIASQAASFEDELSNRDKLVKALHQQKRDLEHELSNVFEQLMEKNNMETTANVELEEEVDTLREERDEIKEKLRKLKTELDEAQVNGIKQEMELDMQREQSRCEIDDLQSEKERLENLLAEMKLRLADSEAHSSQLESSVLNQNELKNLNEQLANEKNQMAIKIQQMELDSAAIIEQSKVDLEKICAEKSSLQSKINCLEATESSTKESIITLKEQVETLEKENSRLQEQSNSKNIESKNELDRMSAEKAALESKIETLASNESSTAHAIATLKEQMEALQAENASILEKSAFDSAQANNELGNIRAEKEALESKLATLVANETSTAEEISALRGKVEALQKENDSINQQSIVNGIKAGVDLENVVAEKASLEAEVKSLLENETSIKKQLTNVQGQMEALLNEKDTLHQNSTAEKAQMQTELAKVNEEKAALESKIEVLEARKISTREELSALRVELESTKEEIISLKEQSAADSIEAVSKLDRVTTEKAILVSKIQLLESSESSAKEELLSFKNQFDSLQKENADLRRQCDDNSAQTQSDLDKITSEKAALESKIECLEASKSCIQEEISNLNEQIDALRRENESLRRTADAKDENEHSTSTNAAEELDVPEPNPATPSQDPAASCSDDVDDSFDEDMFLPNSNIDETTSSGNENEMPFDKARALFSPSSGAKTPSINKTKTPAKSVGKNPMRTPLGQSALQNASSQPVANTPTHKVRTNWNRTLF